MAPSIKASFVIPCKGRLDHLKLTLSSKLEQSTSYDFEVIVVDYNCPQGTAQWCRDQNNDRLRVVEVKAPDKYFNNSHCRNCGARAATGEILCFSDADCFVDLDWLDYILPQFDADASVDGFGNNFKQHDNQLGRGTWAVKKSLWERLRGYDENLEGWGGEELDFFWRMKWFGNVRPFQADLVWTIKHGDGPRVQFYTEKNKHRSNKRNLEAIGRERIINPQGFGDIYRFERYSDKIENNDIVPNVISW